MTLVIPLPPQIESRLRRQAAAQGKDLGAYASQLLEEAMNRPALDEILAPLREQFAATGTTDDELAQQITDARTAYRNQQ